MNRQMILLVCFALAACASSKTREEMLANAASTRAVCSTDHLPAEAAARLRQGWERCFVVAPGHDLNITGGRVIAVERSRIEILSEMQGESIVLTARIAARSKSLPTPLSNTIVLMADIRATESCKSEVTVRSTNSHWDKRANQTAQWLADPTAVPKAAECAD